MKIKFKFLFIPLTCFHFVNLHNNAMTTFWIYAQNLQTLHHLWTPTTLTINTLCPVCCCCCCCMAIFQLPVRRVRDCPNCWETCSTVVSYELSHITYVWKNDEDTLRKSPSLTTLNAYLIQNATTTCPIKASWRGKFRIKFVSLF